jgi:hypothetical protein
MSVFAHWSINGANPSTVGGTGITAKYFTAPSSNFTSGVSTTPSSTNATGQLNIDGDNQLNGQPFLITAAGNFEIGPGGACPSVTIQMVANTGTLATPTYTILASTGAITAQANLNTFYPWFLEAYVVGDTKSGTLSGMQYSVVDNTLTAPAALTNVLSSLDFTAFPVFGVVVRITFSVSESGNAANMYQFQASGA